MRYKDKRVRCDTYVVFDNKVEPHCYIIFVYYDKKNICIGCCWEIISTDSNYTDTQLILSNLTYMSSYSNTKKFKFFTFKDILYYELCMTDFEIYMKFTNIPIRQLLLELQIIELLMKI